MLNIRLTGKPQVGFWLKPIIVETHNQINNFHPFSSFSNKKKIYNLGFRNVSSVKKCGQQ